MTQEDKELLLKDLSARLPHKTYVKTAKGIGYVYAINTSQLIELSVANNPEYWSEVFNIDEIKPYLRPMSSMTEEEFEKLKEYSGLKYEQLDLASYQDETYKCLDFYLSEVPSYIVILVFDWLNKHHFDYRGLIERGLAFEAPDGMYNQKLQRMSYEYFPIEFSSYEDYVKYLKEKGLALEAPEGMYNRMYNITKLKFMKFIKKSMKCIKCGEEISSDWYYKKKGKCGDYTYIGYCATCEDLARYTGNL